MIFIDHQPVLADCLTISLILQGGAAFVRLHVTF
jgi:hypothetical protein